MEILVAILALAAFAGGLYIMLKSKKDISSKGGSGGSGGAEGGFGGGQFDDRDQIQP